MSGETVITLVGNLVDDPELRYTPAGVAVASFRVASTPRTFDKQANEWKDGESLFLSCSAWRTLGENAAATLARGSRVIVQGRLKQRTYDDREGVKRTVFELDVEDVGPSLLRATAAVTKTTGTSGQQPAADQWTSQQQQRPAQRPQQPQPTRHANGYNDEPPY
ncbi:single-stranded DNA-binding protein [Streptomyces sp. RKAG293]|uniref:single-stranded DNA-binding protein n=1 Tax=Streptomyces sp. RKAG293 TaxID=2893403 RepID=UPI00203363F5|nr:single-stranded DNA-binding protein [Streptomyces sp. RKAG293]MCM2420288.1 single-stranded DNA-binding protein [Streptomyces sp. RKAG293]